MNREELLKLKEEVKHMSEEERKEKMANIDLETGPKYEENKSNTNEYVILENGLEDIIDINVALNNVRTKEQIESMINTDGAVKEIEGMLERNTYELADEDWGVQYFTTNQFGLVVSKEFYAKANKACDFLGTQYIDENGRKHITWEQKELAKRVNLTSDDCFEDLAVLGFRYYANANDDDAENIILSNTNTYIVHFNEFYKKISDLGLRFSGDYNEKNDSPFSEYLELVNYGDDGYMDIDFYPDDEIDNGMGSR